MIRQRAQLAPAEAVGLRSRPRSAARPAPAVRATWTALLTLGLLLLGLPAAYATSSLIAPSVADTGFSDANLVSGASIHAADDYAQSFDEDYVVNADGSVDITQNITWKFPDDDSRHGIDRNVTVRVGYKDHEDEYRYYAMTDVSVSSPTGAPDGFTVTDYGSYKRIRIGDADRTVSGVQKYVVTFRLAHVVNDINGESAEFYWNTVSASNTNLYENITASLQAPAEPTQVACFYGEMNSTNRCEATGGAIAQFSAERAEPGQAVSVLAAYPRDAFGDLTPDLRQGSAGSTDQSWSPQTSKLVGLATLGGGVLAPLLAAAGMGTLVWTRGRDEMYAGLTPGLTPGADQQGIGVVRTSRAPAGAVQFAPPTGVQPGMVGTIVDDSADNVDVTGTLIDLAVRGYLTIQKVEGQGFLAKDDWVMRRTTPAATDPGLVRYEQQLLDGIFSGADETTLSSLKNKFSTTLSNVKAEMYAEVVDRGWFRKSPQLQRRAWSWLGSALLIAGAMTGFWGSAWLTERMTGWSYGLWPLAIGLALAGIIVTLMSRRMAARTAQGTAVLVQCRGFEEYLKTAEADQIKWEEAQDLFSRYLPFAIVFGLADRWASVFQEVAKQAAAAGQVIAAPTWWIGAWDPVWGFGGITNTMDDFATTAAGTFTSTPGSSGSSGFSSGGGFSGGGGGGSSGGSW